MELQPPLPGQQTLDLQLELQLELQPLLRGGAAASDARGSSLYRRAPKLSATTYCSRPTPPPLHHSVRTTSLCATCLLRGSLITS